MSLDTRLAKFYENLLCNLTVSEWKRTGMKIAPNRRFKDWDMYISPSLAYEVKADRKVNSTHNLAIELVFQDKDGVTETSGALATTGSHFVIFSATEGDYRWWKIPIDVLRNHIKKTKPKSVGFMGDNGSNKADLMEKRYENAQKVVEQNGYPYYNPNRNGKEIVFRDVEMDGVIHYFPDINETEGYEFEGESNDRRNLETNLGTIWCWGKAYCFQYPESQFSQYEQPPWNTLIDERENGKIKIYKFLPDADYVRRDSIHVSLPDSIIKDGDTFKFATKKSKKKQEEEELRKVFEESGQRMTQRLKETETKIREKFNDRK
jgi:hypothetical protein